LKGDGNGIHQKREHLAAALRIVDVLEAESLVNDGTKKRSLSDGLKFLAVTCAYFSINDVYRR
jgi:NhaP-type Na+/H+ or K+/H+ antiporter